MRTWPIQPWVSALDIVHPTVYCALPSNAVISGTHSHRQNCETCGQVPMANQALVRAQHLVDLGGLAGPKGGTEFAF